MAAGLDLMHTESSEKPTDAEWLQAHQLLSQQPELRQRVETLLASFPRSGLYDDEAEGSELAFPAFCDHVRCALSDSPRTKLLRALDERLLALHDASDTLQQLHEELGLRRGDDISHLAAAVDAQPRGDVHHAWSVSVAACQKSLSPLDDPASRQRAFDGLRSKHAAKGLAPPSEEELASVVQRSATAAAAAAAAARVREAALRAQLAMDATWQRYQRVHRLWAESGAAALWAEYTALDTAEGRERQSRGNGFECGRAAVCFAMLVELLRSASRPADGFWYRRGALWVDARGKLLGEIDLVLMHGEGAAARVCALLEMKSGCFEVAAAFSQHEAKLAAAQRGALSTPPTGPFIAVGSEWQAQRLRLPPPPESVPVFVGTLLPPHPYVIGAEPALTRAVCDALFGRPSEQRLQRAHAHAEARRAPPPPPPPPRELERAVRERMGERLALSPLGCVRMHAERILVVETPEMAHAVDPTRALEVRTAARERWRQLTGTLAGQPADEATTERAPAPSTPILTSSETSQPMHGDSGAWTTLASGVAAAAAVLSAAVLAAWLLGRRAHAASPH